MLKRMKTFYQGSPSHLILTAILLHLLLTIGIYVAGRLHISQIANERGLLTTVAPDSLYYLPLIEAQAETLTRSGIGEWLNTPANLHVKVYSLSLATFSLLFGSNILSAEPLNICLYLAILLLVFKLGEEVFNKRVGLIAAVTVALWPSFLLHTTQFLKDPLYTVAVLGLVMVVVYHLTRTLSWRRGLILFLIGVAEIFVLSSARSSLWAVLYPPVIMAAICLLALRQWREKRFLAANSASAVLLMAASVMIPSFTKELDDYKEAPGAVKIIRPAKDLGRIELIAIQIWYVRRAFISRYENPGSNIDADIRFSNAADLFCYLPRALAVGYLAPFPNMWLRGGNQTGLLGRIISGLEMSVIYVLELLAMVGLWWSRSQLSAWLLLFITIIGAAALGLVVMNVGALYRMRYTFFIVVIILGANGLVRLIDYCKLRKAATFLSPGACYDLSI